MTCFPPLCRPVSRHVRGLFKRAKRQRYAPQPCPPSTSKAESSMTELPTGVPVAEKDPSNAVDVHSSPQSLVCHFCWNTGLFATEPFQQAWDGQSSYAGFSYTTTWTQIHSSVDEGCQWCKLLLSVKTDSMLQDTISVTVGFRSSSGTHGITPKGVHTLRLVVGDAPHFVYYAYAEREDPAATLLVARPRVLQVNAPATRSKASDCITNCIRSHPRCPPPHNATLPLRVIDCLDPMKPKLRPGGGEQAPYVTLSYVSGEDQPYRTTTDNLHSYLLGIDLTTLPQTIKDAIETTHYFGVRYLWVDALCVLHDCDEDMAREISQLPSIHRCAYFTIISASANKASQGFLQDRLPASPRDVSLPFRCLDGQVGTMSLSPAWRQYDGSTEPVHKDAWCLQQRLLSPRALVYASHTLQYQCLTSTVNVGNSVCGPMVGHRLPDLLFRANAEPSHAPLTQNDRKMLRWSWIETVGDYTHRVVANAADKLLAFASIAEVFSRAWDTEYLAGLWRATLVQDLLWYKSFETRYARPDAYRAPSWSWAAIDGRVMAYSVDDRLDPDSEETEGCEIVSCEVAAATSLLPFGKVASGTLTVRAVLVEATWNPDSSMPDLYLKASDTASDSTVTPVTPVTQSSPEITAEPRHIGCAYPDATEDVQEIWAIPIQWSRTAQYAAGLIVSRCPDRTGTYRRVGFFHSPEDASGGLGWMLDEEKREIVLL